MPREGFPHARLVHEYLEAAGRQRGALDEEFARTVTLRLEAGGREYGGSYKRRPVPQLIAEAMEECADIPGWLVLALDRTFEEETAGNLDYEAGQAIRLKLIGWASVAGYLWREIANTLDELRGT